MQCQLGREEVKVQRYPKIVKAKKLEIDQILIVSEKLVSLTALSLFIILKICFGVMCDLISYDLHQNSKIE